MSISGARRRVELSCVLLLALSGPGCGGDGSSGPSESIALSAREETASIVFHYAEGDFVDAARQQAFHDWAVHELGVSPTRKISFNKYLTRNHMGILTGDYGTNAFAVPADFAVHTLFPFDNHEPVHLYTSLIGQAVGLFNEGMAVAFQTDPYAGDLLPRWNGEPLHDVARRFEAEERLAPLGSALTTNDFLTIAVEVRYPEAGSFVRFLLDTRGLDSMRMFLALSTAADDEETVRENFRRVYSESVEQVEAAWLDFLEAG
jgi:hypothetical protein